MSQAQERIANARHSSKKTGVSGLKWCIGVESPALALGLLDQRRGALVCCLEQARAAEHLPSHQQGLDVTKSAAAQMILALFFGMAAVPQSNGDLRARFRVVEYR